MQRICKVLREHFLPLIIFHVPTQSGIQQSSRRCFQKGMKPLPSVLPQRPRSPSPQRARLILLPPTIVSFPPSQTAQSPAGSLGQEGLGKEGGACWHREHLDDLAYLSKGQLACVTHDRETSVDFALLETISDPLSLFEVDNTVPSPLSSVATKSRLTKKRALCVGKNEALTKQFLRGRNISVSFVDNFPTLCDQLLLAHPQGLLSSRTMGGSVQDPVCGSQLQTKRWKVGHRKAMECRGSRDL